jgi:hypothetical protein
MAITEAIALGVRIDATGALDARAFAGGIVVALKSATAAVGAIRRHAWAIRWWTTGALVALSIAIAIGIALNTGEPWLDTLASG